MNRISRRVALAFGALLLASGPAAATSLHMQKLPSSTSFRCLNCHNVQDPATPQLATLNTFGVAFKDNGFRWDTTLAQKRSDDDPCTNGFELGDMNGDGQLDQGIGAERSNPGQSDCTLQINEAAWSALKQLFK